GGRRRGLLLRPGPGEPDRLLHRRQPRRELRRRPLPEVRLHHEPRDGGRDSPPRRLHGEHRRRHGPRRPRLRAPRRLRRLGGHFGDSDKDNSARRPQARGGQDPARGLQGHGGGGGRRVRDHRGRHSAGRHRDDGLPVHRGGRDRRPPRLPPGGRHPHSGARRPGRGGGGPVPAHHKGLRGEQRLRGQDRRGRRRAGAVLEGPQGRVRGDGPHRQRLLRPGLRRPAHRARRGPQEDQRARLRVRDARRERLSRRRRQPPPPGPLRQRRSGRGREGRGPGGRHRLYVPGARRFPDRRAWHRGGQEKVHAEDVHDGGPRHHAALAVRLRPAPDLQPWQDLPDPASLRRAAGALPDAPRPEGRPGGELL
ncbi:MAG: Glycolate dehydrogenase, subunit GlcD, partial [uncultured Rubrobacteraceae bacterium]